MNEQNINMLGEYDFSEEKLRDTLGLASSLAIGRTTLREYLGRARDAGLTWPLPDGLSDADLEHRLFPRRMAHSSHPIPLPDWAYVHAELRRKGVTLLLLWQEYREVHPPSRDIAAQCPAGQWMATATAGTASFTPAGRVSCRR